jgi:hypothetical protein
MLLVARENRPSQHLICQSEPGWDRVGSLSLKEMALQRETGCRHGHHWCWIARNSAEAANCMEAR